MRLKFRWDSEKKEFVEIIPEKKKDSLAPIVMVDEMAPIESMATNKREIFTSKSKYKRHLKDHGYRICPLSERKVEKPKSTGFEGMRELVEKAYMDVKYGRVKFSEMEKEQHLREERACQSYLKRQR